MAKVPHPSSTSGLPSDCLHTPVVYLQNTTISKELNADKHIGTQKNNYSFLASINKRTNFYFRITIKRKNSSANYNKNCSPASSYTDRYRHRYRMRGKTIDTKREGKLSTKETIFISGLSLNDKIQTPITTKDTVQLHRAHTRTRENYQQKNQFSFQDYLRSQNSNGN